VRPSVEVVACSVDDALAAEAAGADRIELCSSIEVGGLTPSIGLAAEVLSRCSIRVVAMVRPRPGGFLYSESELLTMERDADSLVRAGVQGLVLGVLRESGTVDGEACGRFGQDVERVFHRAFDLTPDPLEALDALAELGFTRVLTSGHAATALEGAVELRNLLIRADGRVQVMAGGGVRASNVAQLVSASGVEHIHLGPHVRVGQKDGVYGEGHLRLDVEEVGAVIFALSLLPRMCRSEAHHRGAE
jgi:copper homeostasis protein